MSGRPTKRDIAGSAADLRGYAMLFRGVAAGADEHGRCNLDAATVARAADFFDAVVEELLALVAEEPVEVPDD